MPGEIEMCLPLGGTGAADAIAQQTYSGLPSILIPEAEGTLLGFTCCPLFCLLSLNSAKFAK